MAAPARDLGTGQYLSVTTFRRDGTPVPTAVWFVARDGVLYIWTGADSGKAKRIRRDPRVALASCTLRGRVRGPVHAGTAEILGPEQTPELGILFERKYGLQLRALELGGRLGRRLRPRPGSDLGREQVYIAIRASS